MVDEKFAQGWMLLGREAPLATRSYEGLPAKSLSRRHHALAL